MAELIKLRRGLDIRLQGKPKQKLVEAKSASKVGLKPADFPGLTPKLLVKELESVKAGTPLFYDKYIPEIKFTSPVSGKVKSINRGERRKILEVVIESDEKSESLVFKSGNPLEMDVEEIKNNLMESGLWAFVRQRPYAVIANPKDTPKSIFISTFDSSPLSPDYQFVLRDKLATFQMGVNALSKLTSGKVNLGLDAKIENNIFEGIQNVEKNHFSGPHPAGTVGVQIHHIDPLNKGEIVWYVNVQDVVNIGLLFETGKLNAHRVIALSGSEVKEPQYFNTIIGAHINSLVENKLKEGKKRIISGNVLTGEKVSLDSLLGFYDSQINIIPEGDEPEFFGWALPGFSKFSASRTFFSWLNPEKEHKLDSGLHGGHRAFVLSGQYEKVVPMDILPVQLLKAIIIKDIDLMEQLGIYEIAEEDLALCEVICTSKTPVQSIVRQGINMMIKEFN